MLKIHSIKVGESATNCYLIWDEKTKDAILVDPGDSADYIEVVVADLSINPIKIILTHGHWDHTDAVLELSLAYNVPVLINKGDEFLFRRFRPSPKIATDISDGDSLVIGKGKIKIIETPGHTPGSISLYCTSSKFVVVGDIYFADGTFGRTDFDYSDKKTLVKSLKKIKKLPSSTVIYPGHGEAFNIAMLTVD
ncbi:MBL fold metallo-hydrolase [Patescibacteria group bacterium]|nr:MBL fold metallo-hydrolase [Patescibacteria group bacterium]